MRSRTTVGRYVVIIATLLALFTSAFPAVASGGKNDRTVRFATFNASLNRAVEGELIADLSTTTDAQAANVAEIVQRTRPDVLLINEFDFDEGDVAVDLFQQNYLSVSQNGAKPIEYPYRMGFPSNTGVLSGFDLNKDGITAQPEDIGTAAYANDSWGFGNFPGQFGFAIYSRYPIDERRIRTFQNFLWQDMPDALLPVVPATGESFYTDHELAQFRLSSKNHVDVPIKIGKKTVHFLVSHPTPPVFDGSEDRNGTRNHDEIRFWADYVSSGRRGRYIYDDAGRNGGLKSGSMFVIAGDQNSDPFDGDSVEGSAQLLLEHRGINTRVTPDSPGGVDRAAAQPGNETHLGDPAFDTADFSEPPFGPGNLRADYVLPSRDLKIRDAGVFWPADDDPLTRLTGTGIFGDPVPSSDHRLVWVDVSHGSFPRR